MEEEVNEDGSTRFMTIRVTPEQEAAMEAFFQINNWALIKEAERAKQASAMEGGDGNVTCIIKDQDGQELQVQQVQEVIVNDDNIDEFATVEEVTSQEASNLPQIITMYSNNGEQTQALPQMILREGDQQNMPQIIVQEITLGQNKPISRRVVPRGSVKPGDKIHKCHVCGKTFKQSPSFNGHYQSHFGAKPFNCDICKTGFTLKAALVAHMSIHTGAKPFQCNMCGKEFRRKDDMLSHMRTHTGEKPYECEICGKKFKYRNQIPKHKRMHTGERPYKCSHCEKSFSSNIHLRRHERTHTGERPFKCTVCNKAFTQYGHLQAHARIHSDERPYSCTICNRSFREKKVLKKHEAIHTMDKPFKCSVCGKGFLRQSNMELHAVMHTKGKEGVPRQRPRPKKRKQLANDEMREFVENVLSVVKVEQGMQTDNIVEVPSEMVTTGYTKDGKVIQGVEGTDNLAAFVNFAVESQELEQQQRSLVNNQVPTVAADMLATAEKKEEAASSIEDAEDHQYTLVMQEDGGDGYLITVNQETVSTVEQIVSSGGPVVHTVTAPVAVSDGQVSLLQGSQLLEGQGVAMKVGLPRTVTLEGTQQQDLNIAQQQDLHIIQDQDLHVSQQQDVAVIKDEDLPTAEQQEVLHTSPAETEENMATEAELVIPGIIENA